MKPASDGSQGCSEPEVTVRRSVPSDREAIRRAIVETDLFRQDEIDIALEVLDDALARGAEGHYQSYTAELRGQPVGWLCFGPTPCTVGTFDIYWIVVAPHIQARGTGKKLMRHAEGLIAQLGGRMIVVETSGGPAYHRTRQFYLKRDYREEARLIDFYAPGEDKVVYVKRPAAREKPS